MSLWHETNGLNVSVFSCIYIFALLFISIMRQIKQSMMDLLTGKLHKH